DAGNLQGLRYAVRHPAEARVELRGLFELPEGFSRLLQAPVHATQQVNGEWILRALFQARMKEPALRLDPFGGDLIRQQAAFGALRPVVVELGAQEGDIERPNLGGFQGAASPGNSVGVDGWRSVDINGVNIPVAVGIHEKTLVAFKGTRLRGIHQELLAV